MIDFLESEKAKASTRVIKINGEKVIIHNPGNTTGTKVQVEEILAEIFVYSYIVNQIIKCARPFNFFSTLYRNMFLVLTTIIFGMPKM